MVCGQITYVLGNWGVAIDTGALRSLLVMASWIVSSSVRITIYTCSLMAFALLWIILTVWMQQIGQEFPEISSNSGEVVVITEIELLVKRRKTLKPPPLPPPPPPRFHFNLCMSCHMHHLHYSIHVLSRTVFRLTSDLFWTPGTKQYCSWCSDNSYKNICAAFDSWRVCMILFVFG